MKVLIYEGMPGHGECLSSYYKYFKELGYDVEFVLRTKVVKDKPMWMIRDAKIYSINKPSHAQYTKMVDHLKEIRTKVKNLFKYDLYFIGTFNENCYNFVKFLCDNGVNKNQILFQHHMNYKTFLNQSKNDITLGQNGFTLGMADHDHFLQLPASLNITDKTHNKLDKDFDKINIFFAGLSHIHFKNFELFVKAVDELNDEGKDIKINVCGIREQKDYVMPKSRNINYLGRISFEDSVKQYCNNDFLFVLFDTEALTCLDEHHMFLDGRISGSRNMSIMYKIPLVVQKPYQQSWGFDDTNTISYEGHNYKEILLNLFNMSHTTYNKIMNNLIEKEKEEFETGINNLKKKILSLSTNIYDKKVNVDRSFKTLSVIFNKQTQNIIRVKKPRFGTKKRI